MNPRPALLELRILTGWHAGARATLPTSGTLTIGAPTSDADILLQDLSAEAGGRLLRDGDIWLWQAGEGEPVIADVDARLQCGELLLAVQPADRPWPSSAGLASPARAAAPPEKAADASITPAAVEPPPLAETPQKTPTPRPLWLVVCALLAFGITVFAATATALIHWATPAQISSHEFLDGDALRARVDALNLDARLLITETNGHLTVNGIVADSATLERLNTALQSLRPRPISRVLTMSDAYAQAHDLVHATESGLDIQQTHFGILRLHGVSASDAIRDALIQRLTVALPFGLVYEDASLRTAQVEQALRTALTRHALAFPELAWNAGQLELNGQLGDGDLPRWERAINDFANEFGSDLRFIAHLSLPAPGTFLNRHVRAVVSGETPYVVLRNGQKVMLGGQVGDYRLLEIRPTLSVWEWPGSHQPFALKR